MFYLGKFFSRASRIFYFVSLAFSILAIVYSPRILYSFLFALVYSYIFPRVSIIFRAAYTPFLFLSYIRCFVAGA